MKGNVLKTKLLVKQDNPDEVTESGVIVPGSYAKKPPRGKVIIVGDTECGISEGDTVVFAEHSGTEITLDEPDLSLNGEYILLDNQHVLFYKS